MSSAEKQPFNKINDSLWSKFLSHLEQPNHDVRENTVDRNSILIDTTEPNEPTTCDGNVYTGTSQLANDTDINDDENDDNSKIVVVLSSDSENENETIWSNNYKSKGFTRLWEKARCLILQRLVRGFPFLKSKDASFSLVNIEDQLFPYESLQELSGAVRRYNQDNNLNKKELSFLWSNIIQWLTAIKISPTDPLDLIYDEKYNLIIIDFMIQYINYVTKSYCNVTCKNEIKRKINEIIQTMSVIFNGSTSHAIMTLLRIDYKMEYRILLEPILKKYLEDRNLRKTSNDFIVYLRLVFCFKKWKTIIPLKTEREKINEIAIGKISRYQKTNAGIGAEVHDSTDNVAILPKSVPKTNVRNQAFASISDLIGFAITRKDVGTKTLLIYTSLDLDDAITKYFNLYERYITMYTINHSDDASVMLSQMNIGNSRSSLNSNIGNNLVQQLHQKKVVQHRSSNYSRSVTKNSHKKKHLSTVCDINNFSLSESDISFNKKTKSKKNINLSIIHIDSTDDDNGGESLDLVREKSSVDNKVQAAKNTEASLSVSENSKCIQTSYHKQTTTAPEQRTDKNKENNIIALEVSSEDDSSKSTTQIAQPNITYSKNTENTSKIQNEKRIEADLGNQRFASISPSRCRALVKCVATKPTRKEKHCIPGEVSSTTSPDNVVTDNSSNVVEEAIAGSNSESLEVHSAGGSCQNAREVGTVKVVEQRITPYQPVIINGTFNPGSSILGIDYSNPSSENDDDDVEDTNSSHLTSSHHWKVVEEATSSTEIFQRTQCMENVLFSTLPISPEILTPIEQNLLGPNKSPQNLLQDDVPICSKYLTNKSRDLNDQVIEKSSQKSSTHNINKEDSNINEKVNKTLNTENRTENKASSKHQEIEADKSFNLQSTLDDKHSKSGLPVILKESYPQEGLVLKEINNLSLTTLQDKNLKSDLPVIVKDSGSGKILVKDKVKDTSATIFEEINLKPTIPVVFKNVAALKVLTKKRVQEIALTALENKDFEPAIPDTSKDIIPQQVLIETTLEYKNTKLAIPIMQKDDTPQEVLVSKQIEDISLTTLEETNSTSDLSILFENSDPQNFLVNKKVQEIYLTTPEDINSKSGLTVMCKDSNLLKDLGNRELHDISLNTREEKDNKSVLPLLLKDSNSQKVSSLENIGLIRGSCKVDLQTVLSNEKVDKITNSEAKERPKAEAHLVDLTNNSQVINQTKNQNAIVPINKEVKEVSVSAEETQIHEQQEPGIKEFDAVKPISETKLLKLSTVGTDKSSTEQIETAFGNEKVKEASVVSAEEKITDKLHPIISDSTMTMEDKNSKSEIASIKEYSDLQKPSLGYTNPVSKTTAVHDLQEKNITQCNEKVRLSSENMESAQIEKLLKEIEDNLGNDSLNKSDEQDESNGNHIIVEQSQPIEKELTNLEMVMKPVQTIKPPLLIKSDETSIVIFDQKASISIDTTLNDRGVENSVNIQQQVQAEDTNLISGLVKDPNEFEKSFLICAKSDLEKDKKELECEQHSHLISNIEISGIQTRDTTANTDLKINNDQCLIEDKSEHAALQNEMISSEIVDKGSSSSESNRTIIKSRKASAFLESDGEARKGCEENFEDGNNVRAQSENALLKSSSETRKENENTCEYKKNVVEGTKNIKNKACETLPEILNKNKVYNDKKDISQSTINPLISEISDCKNIRYKTKRKAIKSKSVNNSHKDQSEETKINDMMIKLHLNKKDSSDESPKGIEINSKDKSSSIAEMVLKSNSAYSPLEITKTNNKDFDNTTTKEVRIEEPMRVCPGSLVIESITSEKISNVANNEMLVDPPKSISSNSSNKKNVISKNNQPNRDILQDNEKLDKLSSNEIYIQRSSEVLLNDGGPNQTSSTCLIKDTQTKQKIDSSDEFSISNSHNEKCNLENVTIITDDLNTTTKKFPPEELSDENVKKRTPCKMRIKRRMSHGSNFSKEFNKESDDNMFENYFSSSKHFAMPTDTCRSYQTEGSESIKVTDGLARNISRVSIRKDKTELNEEIRILNVSHINPIKWFKDQGIEGTTEKNNVTNNEPNLCKWKQPLNEDFTECGNKNLDQSIAVLNEENSLNYNPEEILAVATTLINMRNKFSTAIETNNITEGSTKLKRKITKKVSPSTPLENSDLCSPANNELILEANPLKSALKTQNHSSTLKKKMVRYDEENLLELEQQKHRKTSKKLSLKLKTIRSNEGALLKGGNKYIKQRLLEINASLNVSSAVQNNNGEEINGELLTDSKNRRSRNKGEICSYLPNEQNSSATDKERLEKKTNIPNSVYPVRLTSRRESMVNETFVPVESSKISNKNLKHCKSSETSNDKTCEGNVSNSVILPDEKIAHVIGTSKETIAIPKMNIRTINTEDGTKIKIKIKTPEPNKTLKENDFKETNDNNIMKRKTTDRNNKVIKQELMEKMLTRKAVVKIQRIKLTKNTTVSSNGNNTSETVKSDCLIVPNDKIVKKIITIPHSESITTPDNISTGNNETVSNYNKQPKDESENIPLDKAIVKVEPWEEDYTLQTEVLSPRNNVLSTEQSDNIRAKKIDHKGEIILKSSEFILTEEIVNAQAAQCFKESLCQNLRNTRTMENTLVNRSQDMLNNTKIICEKVIINRNSQAGEKLLSQKKQKLSSENQYNIANVKETTTSANVNIQEANASEKAIPAQQIITLKNKNKSENSTKTKKLNSKSDFKNPIATDIVQKAGPKKEITTKQLISQKNPLHLEIENSSENSSTKNKSKKTKMGKEPKTTATTGDPEKLFSNDIVAETQLHQKTQHLENENKTNKDKLKKTTASNEPKITMIKPNDIFSKEKHDNNDIVETTVSRQAILPIEIESNTKSISKGKLNKIKILKETKTSTISKEVENFSGSSNIVEELQLQQKSQPLKIENKIIISALKDKPKNKDALNETKTRSIAVDLNKVQSNDITRNNTPAKEELLSENENNSLKKVKTGEETKTHIHIQPEKVNNISSKRKTQQESAVHGSKKIILQEEKLCLGNESVAESSSLKIESKITQIANESKTKYTSQEEQVKQGNALVQKTKSQRTIVSTEIVNNTETSTSVDKLKKQKIVKESKEKTKEEIKMDNVLENAGASQQTLPIKCKINTDSLTISSKSEKENSETQINEESTSIAINKKIEQDINIVASVCQNNKDNASSALKAKSTKIITINETKAQNIENELKDICTEVKLNQDKRQAVQSVSNSESIKTKSKKTKVARESKEIFKKNEKHHHYDTAGENILEQQQILSFKNEKSTVCNSEKIKFAISISEKEPTTVCKEKIQQDEEFSAKAISQESLSSATSNIKSKKIATIKEFVPIKSSEDLKNISRNKEIDLKTLKTKNKKVNNVEAKESETLVNETGKDSSISRKRTTEQCSNDIVEDSPTQQIKPFQQFQNSANTTILSDKEKRKTAKEFENNSLTAELKDVSRKRKIEQNNHITETQYLKSVNSSEVSESKKIKIVKDSKAQLLKMPDNISSKETTVEETNSNDLDYEKNVENKEMHTSVDNDTEGVIAKLKLLSPDYRQDENECSKELDHKTYVVPDKSKQSSLNDNSSQQKNDAEERKTAKLLDSSIEMVLGNSRVNTTKSTDNEGKIRSSPVKGRLDILTAEKINSSLEKILEIKNKLMEQTPTNSLPLTNEFSNENVSCFTFSTKLEDEPTKKILSKNALNDVKNVSANVPETLFADDESENSNNEDNRNTGEFYAPILSLDDLLIKKDDPVTTQPIINTENSMETNNRHCLVTPSCTVELEVKTSESVDNLHTSSLAINKIANSLESKCAEAEELNPNLEVQEAPFSLSDIEDMNEIDIPNGLNISNNFPDLLDTILFDQVHQSNDCMISGKNSLCKWSQDSFAATSEANRNQTEINTRNENSDLNVKHAKQISTDENRFLETFEEVEVSTTTGFDLGNNFTMVDLLESDGTDFFAFSELDKTQSRSNSFSNDSLISAPTTPNDDNDEDAHVTQSHHIKTVACDHSYNKDIKSIQKPEDNKNIRTSKPSSPNAIQSQSNVSPHKSLASPNKSPELNIFSKSKCTPKPFWRVRKTDEIKTSTPKKISISFDETIPIMDTEKCNNSGSNDINACKSVCKDVYNMPVLESGITSSLINEKKLPVENITRQIDFSVPALGTASLLTNNDGKLPVESIPLKQIDSQTPPQSTIITKISNVPNVPVSRISNVSSAPRQYVMINKISNASSLSAQSTTTNKIVNVSSFPGKPLIVKKISSASSVLRQSTTVNIACNVSPIPKNTTIVDNIDQISAVVGKPLIINKTGNACQSAIINKVGNISSVSQRSATVTKVGNDFSVPENVSSVPEKSSIVAKVGNDSSLPRKSLVVIKTSNASSAPIVDKDNNVSSVPTQSTMNDKISSQLTTFNKISKVSKPGAIEILEVITIPTMYNSFKQTGKVEHLVMDKAIHLKPQIKCNTLKNKEDNTLQEPSFKVETRTEVTKPITNSNPTIRPQPIIRIQSQTNRLERIEPIMCEQNYISTSQTEIFNEHSDLSNSDIMNAAIIHPSRESTPTMDEISKDEDVFDLQMFVSIASTSEKSDSEQLSKRESNTQLECPPIKKVCTGKTLEELSTKKLLNILKREEPVSKAASKPPENKSLTPHIKAAKNISEIKKNNDTSRNAISNKPSELNQSCHKFESNTSSQSKPIDKISKSKCIPAINESPTSNTCNKICTISDATDKNILSTNAVKHEKKGKIFNTTAETLVAVKNAITISAHRVSEAKKNDVPINVYKSDETIKARIPVEAHKVDKAIKTNIPIIVHKPDKACKIPLPTSLDNIDNPNISPGSSIKTALKTSLPDMSHYVYPPKDNKITCNKATSETNKTQITKTLMKEIEKNESVFKHSSVGLSRSTRLVQSALTTSKAIVPSSLHSLPTTKINTTKTSTLSSYQKQQHTNHYQSKFHHPSNSMPPVNKPTCATTVDINKILDQCCRINMAVQQSNSTIPSTTTTDGTIKIADTKLSVAEESAIKAKVEEYRLTLEEPKTYGKYREQQQNITSKENKIRHAYLLERQNQRIAQKQMQDAQRLKRRSTNPDPSHLSTKYAAKRSRPQPQRQPYVNKFSEIEKRQKVETLNSAPLTVPTAWEPKSTSVDEIIAHLQLTTMKKHAPT